MPQETFSIKLGNLFYGGTYCLSLNEQAKLLSTLVKPENTQSLRRYTKESNCNFYLRGLRLPEDNPENYKQASKVCKTIFSLVEKLPPYKLKENKFIYLYRGIGEISFEEAINDKGFMSFSTDPSIADDFSGEHNKIIRVILHYPFEYKILPLEKITTCKGEYEVLLVPGRGDFYPYGEEETKDNRTTKTYIYAPKPPKSIKPIYDINNGNTNKTIFDKIKCKLKLTEEKQLCDSRCNSHGSIQNDSNSNATNGSISNGSASNDSKGKITTKILPFELTKEMLQEGGIYGPNHILSIKLDKKPINIDSIPKTIDDVYSTYKCKIFGEKKNNTRLPIVIQNLLKYVNNKKEFTTKAYLGGLKPKTEIELLQYEINDISLSLYCESTGEVKKNIIDLFINLNLNIKYNDEKGEEKQIRATTLLATSNFDGTMDSTSKLLVSLYCPKVYVPPSAQKINQPNKLYLMIRDPAKTNWVIPSEGGGGKKLNTLENHQHHTNLL